VEKTKRYVSEERNALLTCEDGCGDVLLKSRTKQPKLGASLGRCFWLIVSTTQALEQLSSKYTERNETVVARRNLCHLQLPLGRQSVRAVISLDISWAASSDHEKICSCGVCSVVQDVRTTVDAD